MKAVICTEGGRKIGFGHITRCMALCQALKSVNDKAEIEFIISADESAMEFIGSYGIKAINCNWQNEQDRILDILKGRDAVIIDSYIAEKFLYDEISKALKGKVIMIDDFQRLEYPAGIVVNPSIYGDKVNYPEKEGVDYLLGKDYIILRKEFWEIPEKNIKEEVKNIMITFGGMEHLSFSEKIVERIRKKGFNINFVDSKKNLSATEMIDLMLKADICISAGGQTTYELARVGVPTIGICFAENQKGNLETWSDEEFIEYIGGYKDNNILNNLDNAISKLLDVGERERRSKNAKSIVDGSGANRIIGRLCRK